MNRGFSFPRAASWLLALWILQNAFPALAQPAAGNLAGKVTTLDGQPVAEAEVRVVELNRRRNVEPDGSFRFDGIPAGSYLVEAVSRNLGSAVDRVTVTAGATAE